MPWRALRAPIPVFAGLILTAGLMGLCFAEEDERSRLVQAAQSYFQAEVDGNLRLIWEMLAPSSDFKKTHTFQIYKEMAEKSTIRITSFEIETVVEIEENRNKAKLPLVKKVGYVRVFVTLEGPEFPISERHITMTFLKEGGRWYKG
jgi:hypothetical protein